MGAGADAAARKGIAQARAQALRARLDLVPLYVQALRMQVRSGVVAPSFDGDGVPALADAWFLETKRVGR